MKQQSFRVLPFGDHAVRAVWPAQIDVNTNKQIMRFLGEIKKILGNSILDVTISYNELAIYLVDHEDIHAVINKLETINLEEHLKSEVVGKKIYMPVCYEERFASDMNLLAKAKGLTAKKIIELHTSPEYFVYFIGFLPGFPYLGGLDEKLAHPRRNKPRRKVPQGAVGIAGDQTGVYPSSSPGGWNIIGQTPLPLFDPQDKEVTLLKAGDKIIFYNINSSYFEVLKSITEQRSLEAIRKSSQELYNEYHD